MAEAGQKKNMLRRLVVVVGSTGVGKTKLGIDLAKALNGEVVNGDAMQMYKGLDIASAKPTLQEMEGVPHHLFGFVDPSEKFTVRTFRDRAMPILEDISNRGKTPILVGGTLYYIQSILWPSLIDETPDINIGEEDDELYLKFKGTNSSELYEKLKSIDPASADQLHPSDRRKVLRKLVIFEETGRLPSEIFEAQKDANLADTLRFRANILWLTCEAKRYERRLESRIEKMMENGLWEEASAFIEQFKMYDESNDSVAKSAKNGLSNEEGIFQAMGYREFLPLYRARLGGEVSKAESDRLLSACKGALLTRHRQYSKRQRKWIRNRLLNKNAPVHILDTSLVEEDESHWDKNVKQPAIEICKWFDERDDVREDPPGCKRANMDDSEPKDVKQRFDCESCGVTVIGETQWKDHIASRSHRRSTSAKRKRKKEGEEIWAQLLEKESKVKPRTDDAAR